MDYNKDFLDIVKTKVKKERFEHIENVIEEAVMLSQIYGVDKNKARIAASLHDITKYMSHEESLSLLWNKYNKSFENYPFKVLHQFTGRVVAESLGVDDIDILNAIENHTLGRKNMSSLEKIIYISDFSEKGRNFIEAKIAHELALKSLDEALIYVLIQNKEYLEKTGKASMKESLEAIEFYTKRGNEHEL